MKTVKLKRKALIFITIGIALIIVVTAALIIRKKQNTRREKHLNQQYEYIREAATGLKVDDVLIITLNDKYRPKQDLYAFEPLWVEKYYNYYENEEEVYAKWLTASAVVLRTKQEKMTTKDLRLLWGCGVLMTETPLSKSEYEDVKKTMIALDNKYITSALEGT